MSDRKQELVELFRELAELALLDEADPNSFRVRAYENAAFDIPAIRGDIETMTEAELAKNRGIGKSTASKIREYLETGHIGKLDELRAKYPPAYVELSRLPGLGPKRLARLRDELGVESVTDLRAAIAAARVRELPGFGEKTEENLARALERLGLTGKDKRTPIAAALPVAEELVATLEAMPEVAEAHYCGSLRRFRETIGDIDIVVASRTPAPIMDRVVHLPSVTEVLGSGETKTSVLIRGGMQVDVRVVAPEQLGAALLYFTGSKSHNIRLRQRAIDRGWTLNEYALSDADSGEVIASETEADIYRALELAPVPPPMREDSGEIEAAAAAELPEPVTVEDLRGDLHVHTDLSGDGRSSLQQVVAATRARGYDYVGLTEHGEDLAINGVDRAALARRAKAIARLDHGSGEPLVLHGCELNIGPRGELDYDDEVRRSLHWCVASVHSHFDLDRTRQTDRLIRAIQDPSVRAIGHLTGRLIGRRPGIEIDVDAVLAAAAETDTAIEINASLSRLDAAAEVLRRASELEVLFCISSDAHGIEDLDRMRFGVLQAQRGWVPRDRVVNTWPRKRFLAWARGKHTG